MTIATTPKALAFLDEELARLESEGLLRRPRLPDAELLVLCSNDYLGFGREALAPMQAPGGAGASALVSGHGPAHVEGERAIASWLGTEACLLFSSGYAANVGTVSSLAGKGDLILSDALNHASIIDGCRLSGATVRVFPHRDLDAVARLLGELRGAHRRCVLVSESYFSMDGTVADLAGLRALADRFDSVLVVDEAHALGIYGSGGRGRCALEGVSADALIGTLGKSFGLQGAFVAGSSSLRLYLWNRARSFVFSTAMSPAIAAMIPARVAAVAGSDALRARSLGFADRVRQVLVEGGATVIGEGPIVAWVVGDARVAVAVQARLRELGLWVAAIRPPTVPPGTARLRITASARLTDSEEALVLRALAEAARSIHQP
ncbi:MAG: 8-amino-7-oxononanoate synthase [Polyangiaceae bacterium]|nr:8-amino-7-oxononanoate synthase [Polyangiaceae bacterium]